MAQTLLRFGGSFLLGFCLHSQKVPFALTTVFAVIPSYEYAYTHAPKKMKSTVYAFSCIPCALAAFIGIALSPLASSPEGLIFLYAGLACICLLNTVVFNALFAVYDEQDLQALYEKWTTNY